jgi:hypothetical protein
VSYEYLAKLAISDDEREKLRQLDAPNALALWSMIKASPEALASFLGTAKLEEVKRQLSLQIDDRDRKALETVSTEEFGLGAEMGDPPRDLKKRV